MHRFDVVRHVRGTDRPGEFGGGFGHEEMRTGDVTYLVVHKETGLAFKHCTREPNGVWADPNQPIEPPNWVHAEETAVAYDWFENMQ
jgi:hypothetical protein